MRGTVAYWNFLPPDELNELLTLYKRVTEKTLQISKTFGIEGRKLLRPDDDYEALREFNEKYEGQTTLEEGLRLELQRLLGADPGLAARLVLSCPPRKAKKWTEADIDPKAEAELAVAPLPQMRKPPLRTSWLKTTPLRFSAVVWTAVPTMVTGDVAPARGIGRTTAGFIESSFPAVARRNRSGLFI